MQAAQMAHLSEGLVLTYSYRSARASSSTRAKKTRKMERVRTGNASVAKSGGGLSAKRKSS